MSHRHLTIVYLFFISISFVNGSRHEQQSDPEEQDGWGDFFLSMFGLTNDVNDTGSSEPLESLSEDPESPISTQNEDPGTPISTQDEDPGTPISTHDEDPGTPISSQDDDPGTPISTRDDDPGTPISTQDEDPGTPISTHEEDPGTPISSQDDDPGTPISTRDEDPGTPISTRDEDPGTPISKQDEDPGTPISTPDENPGTPISTQDENPGTPISTQDDDPGTPISTRDEDPGTPISTQDDDPGTPISTRDEDPGTPISRQDDNPGTPISTRDEDPGTPISRQDNDPGTPISTRDDVSDSNGYDASCFADTKPSDYCLIPDLPSYEEFDRTTFKDYRDSVFSSAIVEALSKCPGGNWCLDDMDDYWSLALESMIDTVELTIPKESGSLICNSGLHLCLEVMNENKLECPNYQELALVPLALKLLCEMRQDQNTSRACLTETVKMLHVTMALYQKNSHNQPTDGNIKCSSPAAEMSQSFLCLKKECSHSEIQIYGFAPWQWFVPSVDDIKSDCNFIAGCAAPKTTMSIDTLLEELLENGEVVMISAEEPFVTEDTPTFAKFDIAAFLNPDDPKVLVGLILASVFGIGVLCVMTWACVRFYKSSDRNRTGYSAVNGQDV